MEVKVNDTDSIGTQQSGLFQRGGLIRGWSLDAGQQN